MTGLLDALREEHSVQVIKLVLEHPRGHPLELHRLFRVPLEVKPLHHDPIGPLDPSAQTRDAQAPLPKAGAPRPRRRADDRVDPKLEWEGVWVELRVPLRRRKEPKAENTFIPSDLRAGNANTPVPDAQEEI